MKFLGYRALCGLLSYRVIKTFSFFHFISFPLHKTFHVISFSLDDKKYNASDFKQEEGRPPPVRRHQPQRPSIPSH